MDVPVPNPAEHNDQPIGRKTNQDNPARSADPPAPGVFLIDGQKEIRNIYSVGFLDPRLVMTDVRTILTEEPARHGGASFHPGRY